MKFAICLLGYTQPCRTEVVAEKVETAFYTADESLVWVLLQAQRPEHLVDYLHRAAQLPAGRRENEDVIHKADIE